MALSSLERRILESARKAIQENRQSFVCYAIEDVRVIGVPAKEVKAAKARLRKYIDRQLGRCATLGSWLAWKNGGRWMHLQVQRKARIAWITWMLGEEVVLDAETKRQFKTYLTPPAYIFM